MNAQQNLDPTVGFDEALGLMQSYEIVAPEDRRTRYLFFAGDAGDVTGPGGMRVQSPCIPKKTLYRCLLTPCVTVRKMELSNLIPPGAEIPGSRDRVKPGCSEFWIYAGPEAQVLTADHGSATDFTRNWGLVEVAPDILRGLEWERDVKPLRFQETFFPDWPQKLPATNTEVAAHLQERLVYVETTEDELIARNRDLYLTVGRDMLRAVEAAQRHQEFLCDRTNHGVSQPRGDEAYKYRFDERDEISFRRTGMVKNTQALQRVAEEMRNGARASALDPETLKSILAAVVPAQQPAFTPEMLGAAIASAMQMMQQAQQQPLPTEGKSPTPRPRNANIQRQSDGDTPTS